MVSNSADRSSRESREMWLTSIVARISFTILEGQFQCYGLGDR